MTAPRSASAAPTATSLRALVAAVALSRLVVLAAAFLAENVLSRNPRLISTETAPILRSLTTWDGWWYLGIARDGYHVAPTVDGYHDYAFLPLYPLLVRVLSWPWPQFSGLVAVIIANAAFVGALVLLVRLGERVVGRERAILGAALLALFPFSAVFSMAYTESLFLLLTAGAFLAAETDRRPAAGILLALSALTRLQGAILVVPLFVLLFLRDGRRLRPSQAWLLLGPIAAAAFMGWVAGFAGSASAYGAAQAAWGRAGVGGSAPGQSLVDALSVPNAIQLVTLLAAVFLLVYLRPDRSRIAYTLLTIGAIGLAFASGSLLSIGRQVMVAFPNGWLLAGRRARWFQIAWPIVSLALLGVISALTFAGWFVP
jgi:hypothetical protein